MTNPFNPRDPRYAQHQAMLNQQQQNGQMMRYIDHRIDQTAQSLRDDMMQRYNHLQGALRQQGGGRELERRMDDMMQRADQRLDAMARIAQYLEVQGGTGIGGTPGTIRIEDIPGRRVPYTLIIEIPIGANVDSIQEDSVMINQDGPFVAVKRMATFLSQYEFEVTDPDDASVARFPGRSFGRFRPISSQADICDSQHNSRTSADNWFLTAAAGPLAAASAPLPCAALSLPATASSFRTMEFDGRIEIMVQGADQVRGNEDVPTAWWSSGVSSPWELGALDFFERGVNVRARVLPTHINNAPFGNVDGSCVFPLAAQAGINGYPFLDGQFDVHEGICTPSCVVVGSGGEADSFVPISTDPITRLPEGLLILGFEGYKIMQIGGAGL